MAALGFSFIFSFFWFFMSLILPSAIASMLLFSYTTIEAKAQGKHLFMPLAGGS